MALSILDVGCGTRPIGDVNIDLFIEKTEHRGKGLVQVIEPHKIRNFVKGDAQHLPFRTNAFNLVHSYHVIEHLENPVLMLKEMIRVSNCKVELYAPHRFLPLHHPHKRHFTKAWFINHLNHLGYRNHRVNYNRFFYLPHTFIPLIRFPYDIQVMVFQCDLQARKQRFEQAN